MAGLQRARRKEKREKRREKKKKSRGVSLTLLFQECAPRQMGGKKERRSRNAVQTVVGRPCTCTVLYVSQDPAQRNLEIVKKGGEKKKKGGGEKGGDL